MEVVQQGECCCLIGIAHAHEALEQILLGGLCVMALLEYVQHGAALLKQQRFRKCIQVLLQQARNVVNVLPVLGSKLLKYRKRLQVSA